MLVNLSIQYLVFDEENKAEVYLFKSEKAKAVTPMEAA